jgi:hypothetical protein
MRVITLDLGERHGRRVCIARRLEVVAQITIGKVDVQVKVCFVWQLRKGSLGDGRVGVDGRSCG